MTPDQTANPWVQMIPFFLVFMIFYFLVIKPEKKKQKERKDQISTIKKNDQVVTSGGIHGTVVNIKETTIIIRIDEGVKMEIEKDAVATVKSN